MRVRWRGLELPSKVELDKDVSTPTYGRFIIEPFERGFGTTVGNSLRRILLSSLEGAAVTSVRIAGVPHEISSMDGVLEDVTEIILNVKSLVVKMDSGADLSKTMRVRRNTKGQVTGGDIEADPSVTIANKDLVLATLTDDIEFDIEMDVSAGRGYVTAAENAGEERQIGVIPVDSIFSPVVRVRYQTEDTRVGQRTNYDRLIMEIWTKGTISPEMALVEAAKILRKHLNPFVQYADLGEQAAAAEVEEPEEQVYPDIDEQLQRKLAMSLQDLELSVRAANCLESAKITTVDQLVRKSEADLLEVRSFGNTSLREVKRKLEELGLSLDMDLPEFDNQSE